MKLKHNKYDIPEDDPYKNDLLNRSEFGESLTKIVSNITAPLTISINGAWGTGKTFFLKMWNQHLKNEGFSTIYFSAWEDDYCDDALIALLGQVWANIKESAWKRVGNALKNVLPLIKNASVKVLEETTKLDTEDLKSQSKKILDEYVKATSELRNVKAQLADASEKCREKTGKPLVIIIDELDRCRPLFAIELLEKIKHFFELPGIIFVLGIDREQLGHSIRSVYGEQMDVDGYLRRFIDLEFLLKTNDALSFFANIFTKYGLPTNPQLPHRSLAVYADYATLVSKCFGFSLREMEYLARTIVVASTIDSEAVGWRTLPLLVALKLRDETFYRKIISNSGCNATEIIERLVTEHNAWKLFDLDPETKKRLSVTYGYKLCVELYQFSPSNWRKEVCEIYSENERASRTTGIPLDVTSQWPEKMFHHVVKKLFFVDKNPKHIFSETNFRDIAFGASVNDLIRCIELVGFQDGVR